MPVLDTHFIESGERVKFTGTEIHKQTKQLKIGMGLRRFQQNSENENGICSQFDWEKDSTPSS